MVLGALLWNPTLSDSPPDARGINATVVSLENNMAVPLLFSSIAAMLNSTWKPDNCVKGLNMLPVCSTGRPLLFRQGPRFDSNWNIPQFRFSNGWEDVGVLGRGESSDASMRVQAWLSVQFGSRLGLTQCWMVLSVVMVALLLF